MSGENDIGIGAALDDCDEVTELGAFKNYTEMKVKVPGKNGTTEKTVYVPIIIRQLVTDLFKRTCDWPRRIGNELFIFDRGKKRGESVSMLHNTPAVMAAIQGITDKPVYWQTNVGMTTQEQFVEYLRMQARRYEMVSIAPHYPPRDNVFYSHGKLPPPSPGHEVFWKFIDFFCPKTDAHRTVLASYMLAPMYSVPAFGDDERAPEKPGYLIDSDDGRGVGKSNVAYGCSYLYGGDYIEVDARLLGNDVEKHFTRRALSSTGRSVRIVLLDNVTNEVSSATLSALITARKITGISPYGHGEESRINDLVYTVTANGAALDEDLSTRFYTVMVSRPVDSISNDAWKSNLERFVSENRMQLFADGVDMLANAPHRRRVKSRFREFDAAVLSAACRTDEEFAAADEQIASDAASANVDIANADEFTRMVEERIGGIADSRFDSSRPTLLTDAYVRSLINASPLLGKWSIRAIRQRLLQAGLLPKFSKTEQFGTERRRGFLYIGTATPPGLADANLLDGAPISPAVSAIQVRI